MTTLRKRIWGWCAFDIASQPYYTLVLTFIFAPYFASTVAEHYLASGMDENAADARAQSIWSAAQGTFGLMIGLSAPLLGAFADTAGRRMPWVVVFSILYLIGAAGLWFMMPDASLIWLSLLFFGIGLIGAEFTTIFTNAFLPELGTQSEVGRISGVAYALGYAGGVTALALMLLLFADNREGMTLIGNAPLFGLDGAEREGTRIVGPFTALWFALFMIPFFLWVREPKRDASKPRTNMRGALAAMVQSIVNVAKTRTTVAYLVSSMFYRDALNALYAFGGTYAVLVLDWSTPQVGVFGVVAAITAGIATWLGGYWDQRSGPKPVIVVNILVLIVVTTLILGTSREAFYGMPLAEGSRFADINLYICGAVIGGAGGILQSASRSMMVRHADPERPTEAFGLYAMSGKATAFLAPVSISLFTFMLESTRLGVLPVIFLFLLGLVLLIWVKPQGTQGTS